MSGGTRKLLRRAHMVQNRGLPPTDSKELKPLPTKQEWAWKEILQSVAWNDSAALVATLTAPLERPWASHCGHGESLIAKPVTYSSVLTLFNSLLWDNVGMNMWLCVHSQNVNFPRKVSLSESFTQMLPICLKSLLWWEMEQFSKPQPIREPISFSQKNYLMLDNIHVYIPTFIKLFLLPQIV